LRPFFLDHPGEPVPEEILLYSTVQGKITEADTPTIRLGATSSGLISDPPQSSPYFFTPDALPAATFPVYPGLGQAPTMLDCVPNGLITVCI